MEQLLQQIVFLGGVVDFALAQDAGDEFLPNLLGDYCGVSEMSRGKFVRIPVLGVKQ
ncbi:hypothetical protein [Paenibacillus darwinianus]|uniref:hypothetical protein n=1 Tax=Paenibacillus darwinianus TaxID=1380763 RepID=UPI001CBADDE6|nr:hypothetical protein [Paenibacillus darwinianus]